MDAKKLFHVLVVGGALLGGTAAGCGGAPQTPSDETPDGGQGLDRGDGGSGAQADGGDEGGGVEGW